MFSWTDVIIVLKSRWRIEAAVFLTVIALVAIWTAFSPKGYVAQSSLVFENRAPDPVQDGPTQEDSIAELLSTQADTLQSAAVASEVSRELHLSSSPALVDRWHQATGGSVDVDTWIGSELLKKVVVSPARTSRVLTIEYTAPDPQFAAVIANGFAQAYLNTRLKLQTDPARTYTTWFADRTREVRSNLEQAQARLSAFQQKTGIVDTDTFSTENNRLNALSTELAGAEASAADSQSRAGAAASESPDVQSSGVVQGLRSQIAEKSAELSQMSAELGPNHPDRIAAEAELGALKSKLASEIGTTTRSVHVASNSAGSKEGDLRALVDAQRQRILTLAGSQNELNVLQHDVDSARLAYDSVTQKLSTMRLQSESPTTNASQLDVATPPLFPSKPNIPLRALLAIVLGSFLASGVGVGLEFLRPVVRSDYSLAAAAGAPVIARVDFAHSAVAAMQREG